MTSSRLGVLSGTIASVFVSLLSAGCSSHDSRDVAGARVESNPPKTENFVAKVDAIKPGTHQDVVRHELGEPDAIRDGVVQTHPYRGPAERLIDVAPAGTRYHDWIYKRGDSHYHVFFTRDLHGGDADWEVLAVRSTPKNAVE
jgi:hypothetical protein